MKKVLIIVLFVISIISIENASGLRGGATAQYANQDTLVLQTRALFFEKILYYKQRNPNDSMVVAWFTKVLNYSLSLDSIVKQSELSNYLLKSVFSDSLTNRLRSYLDTAATTDSLTARLSAYVKIAALTDSLNTRLANYLSLSDFQTYLDSTSSSTTGFAIVNQRNYFTMAQYLDSLVARNKTLILRGSMNMSYRYFSSTSDSLKNDDYYVEVAAPGSILDVNLYLKSAVSSPGREYQVKATTLQGVDLRIYPIHGEKIESLALDSSYNLSVDGMSVTLKSDGAQWWVVDLYDPTNLPSNIVYNNIENTLERKLNVDTLSAPNLSFNLIGGMNYTGRYVSDFPDSLKNNDYYVQLSSAEAGTDMVMYLKSATLCLFKEYKIKATDLQGDSISIYPTSGQQIENLSVNAPYVIKTDNTSLTLYSDGLQWRIKDVYNPFTTVTSNITTMLRDSLTRYMLLQDSIKYVSPNNTQNRGKFFSTIQGAITASGSGVTIKVLPGTYTEKIVLKNGVNLDLMKGAVITYSTNDTNAVITDNYTAVTCNITGYGTITRGGTTGNPIFINNSSSNVYIEADLLSTSNACGIVFCQAGNLTVRARLINSSVGTITNGAVRTTGGRLIVDCDSIYTAGDQSFRCNGGFQTVSVKSAVASKIFCNGGTQVMYLKDVYTIIEANGTSSQSIECNDIYNGIIEAPTLNQQYVKFNRFITSSASSYIGKVYQGVPYGGGKQTIVGNEYISLLSNFGTIAPIIGGGEGTQYIELNLLKGPTTLINVIGIGSFYYNIRQAILTNDTGHCLRIDTLAGDVHYNGNVMSCNTSLYSAIEMTGGKLTMAMTDSITNKGGYASLNIGTNAFASIKCPYVVDSSVTGQCVIWYGRGILEADEIRNLADSSATMDIQSSNFMVKGARIKGNYRGGIVSVYNFGSTVGGLILNNCQIINVNPLGNSVKSYDVTDSVIVYGVLQSTYAKASNITFLVGTETASTWVR